MQKTLKIISYIAIFLLCCYALNLRNDIEVLEYKNKNTVGLLNWYKLRIKSYVVITQRQSNIISNHKSSWNELRNDSALLDEMQKLY